MARNVGAQHAAPRHHALCATPPGARSSAPCRDTSGRAGPPGLGRAAPPRSRARARPRWCGGPTPRSEEHTSELQSRLHLVCRLLLEKKNKSDNPRAIVFPILINAQAHNVDRSYSVLLTRHLTLPVTHTHDSLHSHTRRRSALLNTAD